MLDRYAPEHDPVSAGIHGAQKISGVRRCPATPKRHPLRGNSANHSMSRRPLNSSSGSLKQSQGDASRKSILPSATERRGKIEHFLHAHAHALRRQANAQAEVRLRRARTPSIISRSKRARLVASPPY